MGCLSCIRTTPMPLLEAYVSISKGNSKLGRANTSSDVMASFNFKKATSALKDHLKASFLSKSVSGAAKEA